MMEKTPFIVGDIVVLNSGGPPMKVVDCDETTAAVAWKANDGSPREIILNNLCLTKIEAHV